MRIRGDQGRGPRRKQLPATHLPGVLAVLRVTLLGPWQMAPGPIYQAELDTEGNVFDMEVEVLELTFPYIEVPCKGLYMACD